MRTSPKRIKSRWLSAPIALAVLALSQASADAAAVTFAQFTQAGPGTPFAFVNQTTFGQAGIVGFSTPVNFNFTLASGLSTVTRAATLTLTAVTNAPASSAVLGGSTFIDQPINGNNPSNPADVLTIVENSTGKTLLSLTFTGDIVGKMNDPSASLTGSTDPAAGNNMVNYSSAFLNFGPGVNSYLLGLTSDNPALSIGPGGFLNSFVGSIGGSFSATVVAAVPEPASLAMFGTGLIATAVLASQRKRLSRLYQN